MFYLLQGDYMTCTIYSLDNLIVVEEWMMLSKLLELDVEEEW